MSALLRLSAIIDKLNTRLGQASSWLLLVAVIVSAVNAIVRKAFNESSNAWLELQWYLFGATFLIAASYTLLRNDHVRIDIVSNILPRPVRHFIDLIGHSLFLLPLTLVMILESAPFAWLSFRSQEYSSNAGGLIVWPAKALILLGFVLLFLQGISEIIKTLAIMAGAIPDPRDQRSEEHLAEELIMPEERRS